VQINNAARAGRWRRPGLKLEVQRGDLKPPGMYCKDCEKRRNERIRHPRPARQGRVAPCDRCGGPILPLPDRTLRAGDGTLAQLARFGLAITGDPLLELRREGI